MSIKVIHRKLEGWDKLEHLLANSDHKAAKVGWFSSAKYPAYKPKPKKDGAKKKNSKKKAGGK